MIFTQCNLLYTSKGKYEKDIVSLRCGHVNQYAGPQVRFQKPEIEAVAQGKMPVAVIEMKDYGTMNGQAVLEFAMKLLQE